MEGVTILSESPYFPIGLAIVLTVVATVVVGLSVVCVIMRFRDDDNTWLLISVITGVVAGVLVALTIHGYTTQSHKVYKVTIDDNVSFNDFIEKYEIVDQDGQIYTVKERNEK